MTRTYDAPLTADGAAILVELPAGAYELRPSASGGVLVVSLATTDAVGRPTRAQLEDANTAALKRFAVAAGGAR